MKKFIYGRPDKLSSSDYFLQIIENVGGKFNLSFRLAISFDVRNASASNARAGIEAHEFPGIRMKSDKRVGYKFRGSFTRYISLFEKFFSTYHALDSASQEDVNGGRTTLCPHGCMSRLHTKNRQ